MPKYGWKPREFPQSGWKAEGLERKRKKKKKNRWKQWPASLPSVTMGGARKPPGPKCQSCSCGKRYTFDFTSRCLFLFLCPLLFTHFGDTQEVEILFPRIFGITRRNIKKLFSGVFSPRSGLCSYPHTCVGDKHLSVWETYTFLCGRRTPICVLRQTFHNCDPLTSICMQLYIYRYWKSAFWVPPNWVKGIFWDTLK